MSQDLCRLCLSKQNLGPLFGNCKKDRTKFSKVLKLITGVTIKPKDGLPQNICSACTELVNSSLTLRNQSKESETKLLELGFIQQNIKDKKKLKKEKEVTENLRKQQQDECKNEEINDISLPEFEIEVEFDRITDIKIEDINDNCGNIKEELRELSHPKIEFKPKSVETKRAKKEKSAAFLELVEGKLDPKGLIRCKVCKKSVNKWPSFVSHAKLHLGFKFVCEYCGKSFISSTQLNRHCRSYHGMRRELQCKHCDYLALDNAQLMLHVRRAHTGERPFVCDLCAASYFSRKCLIQHLESHQTEPTVQCEKCSAMFKSRRHLAKHTYNAHASKEFTYKCPICGHIYRNLKYIRVHLRKAHSSTTKEAKIIKIKL